MKDSEDSLRSDLLYSATAAGAKIFIRKQGISFCWYQSASDSLKKDSAYRMDVDFVNPSISLQVTASQPQSTYSNYFVGNVSASNVLEYNKVTFTNLWNDIDLELTIDSNGFSYKYKLAKGANPSDIKLSFNGGKNYNAGSKSLNIASAFGNSIQFNNFSIKSLSPSKTTKPTITSNLNSSKVNSLTVGGYNTNNSYEIEQSVYSTSTSTVPTPTPISTTNVWGTYYGGTGQDIVNDVFVDIANNIYVTGTTTSTVFPTFNSIINSYIGGGTDGFIIKFKPDRSVEFSTYIGGVEIDQPEQIAVNSAGEIYLTGWTSSRNFPVLGTGYKKSSRYPNLVNSNRREGFITKISANGRKILWSTYYSNTSDVYASGLAIASDNSVYIVGSLESIPVPIQHDLDIIPFGSAYFQDKNNTKTDVVNGFIARFSSTNNIIWGTYFGGLSSTAITSCATDEFNNLFILGLTNNKGYSGNEIPPIDTVPPGGFTASNTRCGFTGDGTMPICVPTGAFAQVPNAGSTDLIITKFNNQGIITWSTLYGGSGQENYNFKWIKNSIATDVNGDVYISGSTNSTNFPGPNLYSSNQNVYGGGISDGFVVRFSNTGQRKWASFIGGNGTDEAKAIKNYYNGFIVAGVTNSSNFPTLQRTGSYFDGSLNNKDGFYNEYNNLNQKQISTYVGGLELDEINSIGTANNGGNVVIGGQTLSDDFPVQNILASNLDYFDGSYNAGGDGFIMNLFYNCGSFCRTSELVNITTEHELGIYPNPTNGLFVLNDINMSSATKISVYSNLGKLILHKNITSNEKSIEFDLTNYPAGLYLIKVQNSMENKTFKLLKQ